MPTKTVTIVFKDVGRDGWSGNVTKQIQAEECQELSDGIAEAAYREATKHLMSRNVEAIYNADTNEGRIYAGFHVAGRFHVRT